MASFINALTGTAALLWHPSSTHSFAGVGSMEKEQEEDTVVFFIGVNGWHV
jgi:hypothetical protein